MKLTYDPRYNIGYLRFQEPAGSIETIHISDELICCASNLRTYRLACVHLQRIGRLQKDRRALSGPALAIELLRDRPRCRSAGTRRR